MRVREREGGRRSDTNLAEGETVFLILIVDNKVVESGALGRLFGSQRRYHLKHNGKLYECTQTQPPTMFEHLFVTLYYCIGFLFNSHAATGECVQNIMLQR